MLKIEYMSIDDLAPYDGNAKLHPQKQVEQIAESIKEFGFNDPIAIDENGTIIEGHGRVLAAQMLGMDNVPVIRLDGLTDEQKRAYTLVHNQLTMNSGFDIEQLQIELGSITSIDMDTFEFEIPEMFSMDDIREMQGYDEETSDKEWFESAFTFPVKYKKQIISYLRKHKAEIVDDIIKGACEDGEL